MPITKNALIRLKYLDRLLSDRHHFYDRKTLWEKVNEMLNDAGFRQVTRRCIETDIIDLMDAPFNAPIEKYIKNGKECLRYERGFSIFKEELSWQERNLLSELLSTIGQFDGLDNFEWLGKFKIGLEIEDRKQVISFSNNPYLRNSNLLGTLFDMISNEVVIRLSYHTFTDDTIRSIDFHPYLLKQYNDRWFLLGAADSDKAILTFALDRIDNVEPLPERKYEDCTEDLAERFEDIVGVTLYEDREVEHIIFWVSDYSKDYIITKPIHESQKSLRNNAIDTLLKKYPNIGSGGIFSIDCIPNYELIRELCSFGKELIVLEPSSIKDEIFKRISLMVEEYSCVRT